MQLSGRLQAAIDILDSVTQNRCSVPEILKDWGRTHRFAGSSDRAAIGNIVYDSLRNRASIAWKMESDSAHDIAFGALLYDGTFDIKKLMEILEKETFTSLKLLPLQQRAWRERNLVDAPDHIQADVPQWCALSMEKFLKKNWIEEGKYLAKRPPLDLRINNLKVSGVYLAQLMKEPACKGGAYISWYRSAFRIPPVQGFSRHPNLRLHSLFQRGLFEVQDLGSQIAARLCRASPGMLVLDYCAGAGGKTMALAADMQNQGVIYAYDVDPHRLFPIQSRLQRAGISNTRICYNEKELYSLIGQIDLVVIDAPCTGTGTWRRRPDNKWRLTERQLEKRLVEQGMILEKASTFVKEKGELVYITCSLLFKENDKQIENFLKKHTNFYALDMSHIWHEMFIKYSNSFSSPFPLFSNYGLVLSPFTTETDGFFIAVIKKQ